MVAMKGHQPSEMSSQIFVIFTTHITIHKNIANIFINNCEKGLRNCDVAKFVTNIFANICDVANIFTKFKINICNNRIFFASIFKIICDILW